MKARIRKALKDNKGFTMIELMVVIVIILILAAIAIPSFSRLVGQAKNAAATAEARTVLVLAQFEVESQGIDSGDSSAFGVNEGQVKWTDILEDAGITDTAKQDDFTVEIENGRASVTYAYGDGDDESVTLPEE